MSLMISFLVDLCRALTRLGIAGRLSSIGGSESPFMKFDRHQATFLRALESPAV